MNGTILLFSIFTALYLTKVNGFMLWIQYTLKQKLAWSRIKPLDCTACMSFWFTVICHCVWFDSYTVMAMSAITAFSAGSLLEKVWYKV